MDATTPAGGAALTVPLPVALCGFEGWNDAANSASRFIDHVAEVTSAQERYTVCPDDYHDFQVVRPLASVLPDGSRGLSWPKTTVSHLTGDGLVLVRGIEPSMRWRQYCREILEQLRAEGVETVITVGALLADLPHTRPVDVSASSSDADLQRLIGIEASAYEGPTGIVGVLEIEAQQAGFHAMSLWATVPHYVSQPPCPPATLALLRRIEDITGVTIEAGDLPERATQWRASVDAMATEDPEIAEYVSELESAADAAQLSQTSGESLAREFERYLRRHGDGPSPKG